MSTGRYCLILVALALATKVLIAAETLPGTQPLTLTGDLSAQMVAGIDKFLDRELEASIARRAEFWKRDFTSAAAYERSIAPNRLHLRTNIGAVDARLPVKQLEFVGGTSTPSLVVETDKYTVRAVRWPVFEGVYGEGLLLEPKGKPAANVVALPDADQTPEQLCGLAPGIAPESQFARRLAEHNCRVLVPVLLNRQDTFSGSAALGRWTNLPHREWIWRMAYELGRNVIGYEVQKVLAAVDWFSGPASGPAIGVIGYGEGGLLALHAAALDPRIQATLVSGHFDSRQRIWTEPGYRAVWKQLKEFGDAEMASLVVPRALLIEYSAAPAVSGPPAPSASHRNCAAPGGITTPEFPIVEAEVERAKQLSGKFADAIQFLHGAEGTLVPPGSPRGLEEFLKALGGHVVKLNPPGAAPTDARKDFDPVERQHRAVKDLEDFTQALLQVCEHTRAANFWNTIKATNAAGWEAQRPKFQKQFWEEVIGKWTNPVLPFNARSRLALSATNGAPLPLPGGGKTCTAYDVVLDVFPDVYAWGVLVLPKDLKPGERRPVVVCQHGLEGLPEDCVTQDQTKRAFQYYKGFATALAERGFITFAPHNPYRGQDAFRVLQRKSNPLGKTLFSTIIAQHDRILEWLATQPFVDPKRIAFYGLSYGGKTAKRVPALLDRYCLSIGSGDFNEWVRKNASTDYFSSYLFAPEYEIFEWDLGHTYNYAEMAALIAPRPFMVERGHFDGVGTDEWVNYEYAKVRRFYAQLNIPERTEIEHFWGPHTIHGQGTYEFLYKHLSWPKPK